MWHSLTLQQPTVHPSCKCKSFPLFEWRFCQNYRSTEVPDTLPYSRCLYILRFSLNIKSNVIEVVGCISWLYNMSPCSECFYHCLSASFIAPTCRLLGRTQSCMYNAMSYQVASHMLGNSCLLVWKICPSVLIFSFVRMSDNLFGNKKAS